VGGKPFRALEVPFRKRNRRHDTLPCVGPGVAQLWGMDILAETTDSPQGGWSAR